VGKVKIILNHNDFNKLKPGDILVAKMTSVDYLPIMKNAAAFITDEGGLACHAAVVSREFNIPCIIGTKIATQVLEDGDIVEVNADNGVVSKISS
jgi:pyruvate,water dikinase